MAEPLQRSLRNEIAMQLEIERCRREIAGIEEQLRSGYRDMHGLLLALTDWHAELRLLEREALEHHREAA